jgi:hypothetical protein
METLPPLYTALVKALSCHRGWLDARHLQTLAWMVSGLIQAKTVSLGDWALYVHSRATLAASSVRRFRRFLDNPRIAVEALYAPLLAQVLLEGNPQVLYVALDTSLLWNRYCVVRLSLIYRGRAVPMVWKVLEHGSAMVAFETYQELLDQAAQQLFPFPCKVVLLADRGFADTELMDYLGQLGWHWRLRIKESFWIYQAGQADRQIRSLRLREGQPRFWQGIQITHQRFGPVCLALGRPFNSTERWVVVSDEPTSLETFLEYGRRFDIEENFLDDKSNGFQLETSQIRSAEALTRLCLVLAVATLYLVSQGTKVVHQGKRRWVDAHWFRGHSYLKIGWHWVLRALTRSEPLIVQFALSFEPDPEPAMASRKQHHQRSQPRFMIPVAKAA